MPKYNIPSRFKEGFEILLSLTPEQINIICSVLNETPAGTGLQSFQNAITAKLNIVKAEKLAITLFSFGELLVEGNSTIDELSKNLTESLVEERDEKLSATEIKLLEDTLKKIFENSTNLRNTFKAVSLIQDNEKIFKEARIISDIRLIFDEDVTKKERNSIIIHRLKLEYQQNNKDREFYISLDNLDLKNLKNQIDRAFRKEEAMRENYKDSITFIEVTD